MRSHLLAKFAVPVLLIFSVVTSCSQDNNETEISTTTTIIFLNGADPTRVLLAAVILASGDIEKAITEGLVTSIDVDAATAAIKNGTLHAWHERAETELGE